MNKLLGVALGILFLNSIIASAATVCDDKVRALLKLDSEMKLFEGYPAMHICINCNEVDFSLDLFIHESTHMADIQVPQRLSQSEMAQWFKAHPYPSANCFLLNGKNAGTLQIRNAPKPSEIILPFLKKYYSSALLNPALPLGGFVKTYLENPSAAASRSFENGHTTELNAYGHGAVIEKRLSHDGKIGDSQKVGLWFFLLNFKIYLHNLKTVSPLAWSDLNSPAQTKVLKNLFLSTFWSMRLSGACQNMSNSERAMYSLFVEPRFMDELQFILRDEPGLFKSLRCSL